MNLETQPNEKRCRFTRETHVLAVEDCCPVSRNPRPGSTIRISYIPADFILEVASLFGYVASYRGGRGEVRSMEGMVQQIAQDCANIVGVRVDVEGDLVIEPSQRMLVECFAHTKHDQTKP